MEQLWNYYGFVGIAIMALTFVVMVCEFIDRDRVAIALNHPGLSSQEGIDFWIPAWFEYRHRWVKILVRLCMAVSVILMMVIAAGPLYDEAHRSLKAPFAYTLALFENVVVVYLWMQIIRIIRFLLLMLMYMLFWFYCWILGFDTNRI